MTLETEKPEPKLFSFYHFPLETSGAFKDILGPVDYKQESLYASPTSPWTRQTSPEENDFQKSHRKVKK